MCHLNGLLILPGDEGVAATSGDEGVAWLDLATVADQGTRLRAVWDEFESKSSPEARFAKAVDRLQPMLLNRLAGGG